MGFVEIDEVLQVDSMNDSLRNSLWNVVFDTYGNSNSASWFDVYKLTARDFLKVPIDELDTLPSNTFCRVLKGHFFGFPFYSVYDFLEFLTNRQNDLNYLINRPPYELISQDGLIQKINFVLEREHSGYRFIGENIIPITDATEITQIKEVIATTQSIGLYGAYTHIQSAIKQFGQRPNPDFRNTIKESISAVESVVKQIAGCQSNGLDEAMKVLATKISLHGALKEGFIKLYGYTSDEKGIRHCLLDEQTPVGLTEAKYMLVACSAFVYFLIAKAQDAGVLPLENGPAPP